MKKYYMFDIKKEVLIKYQNNPDILYKTLENLKILKNKNLSYGISLYEQICNIINVELLDNYFKKFKTISNKNNKYYIRKRNEKTLFIINHSCILCFTNINIPIMFKRLKYYSSNLFICDFNNKEFFFLKDKFKECEYNL